MLLNPHTVRAALLVCRDCCLLFVPCYSFADEARRQQQLEVEGYTGVNVLHGEPLDAEPADQFRLAHDFEPLLSYYAAFGRLDAALDQALTTEDAPRRPATSPTESVSRQLLEAALQLLESQRATADEQRHAFNLVLLAVRAQPAVSAERERLIREYERHRAYYSVHDGVQRQQALYWLEVARDTRFSAEQRVLWYQKSLYYTHSPMEKELLRGEYVLYCERLKR